MHKLMLQSSLIHTSRIDLYNHDWLIPKPPPMTDLGLHETKCISEFTTQSQPQTPQVRASQRDTTCADKKINIARHQTKPTQSPQQIPNSTTVNPPFGEQRSLDAEKESNEFLVCCLVSYHHVHLGQSKEDLNTQTLARLHERDSVCGKHCSLSPAASALQNDVSCMALLHSWKQPTLGQAIIVPMNKGKTTRCHQFVCFMPSQLCLFKTWQGICQVASQQNNNMHPPVCWYTQLLTRHYSSHASTMMDEARYPLGKLQSLWFIHL